MKKAALVIFILFSALRQTLAQEPDTVIVFATVVDGDTIPVVPLQEVRVFSWRIMDSREERRMTRLMRNVRIAYPYARLAGIKLREYEDILASTPDKKDRKEIMKQVEAEIEAEYGEELRGLTISQGKILLKLIDRETGDTSYELVTEFRGEFRAVFYQAFARLFGYNLKVNYDPEGEDEDIETIVRLIENGLL